jgi:molybdopterin/thiamine biosynthesis adenylyltransferase
METPPEIVNTITEDRYARHHLIDWWDQGRLAGANVMVAGAGAIGNEVIKLLALMGVGHLLIVDFDRIELSNLTRSVLFRESDVGRSKAAVAAERARQINPELAVRSVEGDLEFDIGLGVYRAMDVVIGCLDSLNARLALNRACCHVGAPWLNGGIEATIAEIGLYQEGRGACFECTMSAAMWERRNQRFSCGGLQVDTVENKMPTTATVASITAGYLVNEALFLLHCDGGGGKAGLDFSQKLTLTFKPYSFHIFDIPASGACLAHDRWEPIEVTSMRAAETTVANLLNCVGMTEGVLELGFDLLTEIRCQNCGQAETVLRPIERCGLDLNRCPVCATPSRQPDTISWVEAASPYADRTLAQLGIPEYAILAIKSDAGRRYIQLTGEYIG